ncbi:MAG: hypothetical protein EP301_04695 [Gammaproteobacteria bacterium]|jgi:hypothetical protein|nr:MAG: hypothetical protein EP301_04695 [Gammaproteobacteria bacterium]
MSDQSAKPVAAVVREADNEEIVNSEAIAEGAEPTAEVANDAAGDQRAENLANLKKVGTIHFVAVVAALTLFGAANTWALTSGIALALVVSVAAAYIAATVLSAIVHEYGHYVGTVLSGAPHKVLKKPARYFFMFNFDMKAGTTRQALWLSWGGVLGSWLLVATLFLLLPMDGWASAALVATALGNAVNASVFEVPVIRKTMETGEFEKALYDRLESPGLVKMPGVVVGLLAFALLT